MRINKFVALSSDLSRRAADKAIAEGRVLVNGVVPEVGYEVTPVDTVTLDGNTITPAAKTLVMLNKPTGYVVSRDGQGSQTIYDLLPPEYQALNPIGRLDKDSSGLLLLTNDGDLAQELSHPSQGKRKVYGIRLDTPLQPLHRQMISDKGVMLEDGLSKFELERLADQDEQGWRVTMHEGRNRQIRRTFAALDYTVTKLHRTQFGEYKLAELASGHHQKFR
jgi:23S rRNA pseudouridine2605 synthase